MEMKAIINGKLYNTETATYVTDTSFGNDDFSSCVEQLYRKKNGEFFIFGYGGPMSKYSHRCSDGSFAGDSCITPLSDDEAREWCEEYATADTYIELFGDVPE